jgi:DhnA family fructose-bisphosphate aldolase class Ia
VVAAGGPKAGTLHEALVMADDVIKSGTAGMTIGRNIWGVAHPTEALQAFKSVIHDRLSPQKALKLAGL